MASNKSIAALRRREWSHLCATTVIAAQPKSGRLQRTGVSHFRAGGLRARDVRFGSGAVFSGRPGSGLPTTYAVGRASNIWYRRYRATEAPKCRSRIMHRARFGLEADSIDTAAFKVGSADASYRK